MAISDIFSEKFLIIDLGASLNHTHHKHSVYAFSELLRSNDISHEIWIPFGSELKKIGLPIKKKLIPGTHAVSFNIFNLTSWLDGIYNKFLSYAIYSKINFLMKLLVYVCAKYLCLLIYSKANGGKIRIIFPTACPFAIKTVYLLERHSVQASVFFRLTNTSENRGKLSELYNFRRLIHDSKKFEKVKIRFGIETANYFKNLNVDGDPRFFDSPFPNLKQSYYDIINPTKITISFLGHPTKNKGREHIVPIIREVSKRQPQFKWQVHLYADDPLESVLTKLNLDITIVKGKISNEVMNSLLLNTSVLCLPYDTESFKLHASAMLYQSMDYLKPVISFDGTSFSSDIYNFNSGAVAKNRNSMCNELINIDIQRINRWIGGCKTYNNYRDFSNQKFLELYNKKY